jgi:hypothetical protein
VRKALHVFRGRKGLIFIKVSTRIIPYYRSNIYIEAKSASLNTIFVDIWHLLLFKIPLERNDEIQDL